LSLALSRLIEGRTDDARRPSRVVIGEDDVLLRKGVARILTDAGLEVVARFADADDWLKCVLAYRPASSSPTCRCRPDTRRTACGPRWSDAGAGGHMDPAGLDRCQCRLRGLLGREDSSGWHEAAYRRRRAGRFKPSQPRPGYGPMP
jgi:hypothetical protein